METYPVDINEKGLYRALKRSAISRNAKIIFMDNKNEASSSLFFSSLEKKYESDQNRKKNF